MKGLKQLDLLKEIKKRHPDRVVQGWQGKRQLRVILIELGNFSVPEMMSWLKEDGPLNQDTQLYVINFQGIDLLAPSVARTLLEFASAIASDLKKPVILTKVGLIVRESLESEASQFDPPKVIWGLDEQGNSHLVGQISPKLGELLELLEEQGTANASKLAALIHQTSSRKVIGNLSVYLQKLYSAGLVGREKVTALEREDAQRGWTYNYLSAPNIYRLQSIRADQSGQGIWGNSNPIG